MSPKAKALTLKVIDANPKARRFYDVNLRENCYEARLVNELMSLATAVKLNDQEVGYDSVHVWLVISFAGGFLPRHRT